MPTIIDDFIVRIGLDPAPFKKGSRDATDAFKKTKESATGAGKDIEQAGEKSTAFFRNIRKEAVTTFAVLLGANGIREFVSQSVTDLRGLKVAATGMGESVQNLAAFQAMIVRNGGSAKDATASIQGLAQATQEWRTLGNTASLPFLQQIGASAGDSGLEVYRKFAKWAEGKPAQLVTQIGQGLGLDAFSIDQARKGLAVVDDAISKSKKLGVATEEQTRKVSALQDAWRSLAQTVSNSARQMLADSAPWMTATLEFFNKLAGAHPMATKVVVGTGVAATTIGGVKVAADVLTGAGAKKAAAKVAAKAAAPAVAEGVTAGAAAEGATAGGVIGGLARFVGRANPWVLGATMLFTPGKLNEGEDEALRRQKQLKSQKVTTEDRANQMRKYFLGLGYKPSDVEGMVAGGIAETRTLDPTATNPTSGAYGVGQWLGTRQQDFKKVMGYDIHQSDLMAQLQFMQWEFTHTEKGAANAITGSGSAEEALVAYILKFMRPDPKGDTTHLASRGDQQRGGAWLAAQANAGASGGNTTNTVTIGQVVVNTQATDAKGIAKDISGELAVQAASGLGG